MAEICSDDKLRLYTLTSSILPLKKLSKTGTTGFPIVNFGLSSATPFANVCGFPESATPLKGKL